MCHFYTFSNDPVYAAVQWISEVWQLLNYYINKMGLLEVLAGKQSQDTYLINHISQAIISLLVHPLGPRHFLYCPVERNRPDFVYK